MALLTSATYIDRFGNSSISYDHGVGMGARADMPAKTKGLFNAWANHGSCLFLRSFLLASCLSVLGAIES